MRILVLRFSAFGDVAMTVPVVASVAAAWPDVEFVVAGRPFVKPLFDRLAPNVRFEAVDLGQYKGLTGLLRLGWTLLKKYGFDAVADLHDVLRTKVLRTFFHLCGVKVAHIDKGRPEKRALTRSRHKEVRQLPTSFDRYFSVFTRLGLTAEPCFHGLFREGRGDASLFSEAAGEPDGLTWIGLAPFAAHQGKVLPEQTVEALLRELASHADWRVMVFGGGERERRLAEGWAERFPNVSSMVGRLKLPAELSLMSHLRVMVSMDSANMHLASLVDTPVVSVWGATHPYAGFMGWNQREELAVQTALPCRPCSIFGNKPCLRGDYACLHSITARQIVEKIEAALTAKRWK